MYTVDIYFVFRGNDKIDSNFAEVLSGYPYTVFRIDNSPLIRQRSETGG